MHEVAVQRGDDLGVLEHDLGHERTGLQVAAALELEQVTLGADDGAGREPGRAVSQSWRASLATVAPPSHATS